MRVWYAHPRWRLSCRTCEAFAFDTSGNLMRDGDGEPEPRGACPTPCSSCPKVPAWAKARGMTWKELRAEAVELTDANRSAFDFYHACKGTGRFPDDPIVEWVAGIIRRVEDEQVTDAADRTYQAVNALIGLLVKRV